MPRGARSERATPVRPISASTPVTTGSRRLRTASEMLISAEVANPRATTGTIHPASRTPGA